MKLYIGYMTDSYEHKARTQEVLYEELLYCTTRSMLTTLPLWDSSVELKCHVISLIPLFIAQPLVHCHVSRILASLLTDIGPFMHFSLLNQFSSLTCNLGTIAYGYVFGIASRIRQNLKQGVVNLVRVAEIYPH